METKLRIGATHQDDQGLWRWRMFMNLQCPTCGAVGDPEGPHARWTKFIEDGTPFTCFKWDCRQQGFFRYSPDGWGVQKAGSDV